jgi:tRNA (uracil-5-)-methyltransferase TRM9
MDRHTVHQLNDINLRFYAGAGGREFSQTRQSPWPGFAKVMKQAPQRALDVLDVGCGNGRFGEYVATHAALAHYTGVDASPSLLVQAQAKLARSRTMFVQADIVTTALDAWLPAQRQDLTVALGVMHHIPSEALRVSLVHGLVNVLNENGLCALTFWRLDRDPRYARRLVPWSEYNATAVTPAGARRCSRAMGRRGVAALLSLSTAR